MTRFILLAELLIQLLCDRDRQVPECSLPLLLSWLTRCWLLVGYSLLSFLSQFSSFCCEQVHQMGLHGKAWLDRLSGSIGQHFGAIKV